MNPYIYAGLTCFFGMVTYFIAAIRYYKMGYDDAIEDILKLSEEIKKSITNVLETNEE
jgi:hypothetical protein